MCGITAIFENKINLIDKEKFIKDSLGKIVHRGSENFEYKIFKKAGLGTNRLPITGRLNGIQPISNYDNTKFVIQNGEIFNYKELKIDLEGKGYRFKTDSDTEVLIHMFDEYGEKMVEKINSEMFAFIIYDEKNNSYFVARDRLGVKPLYYAVDNFNNTFFSSELKQLSDIEEIKVIHEFPKGCYMLNGEIKSYYSIKESNKIKNFDKAKKGLTDVLISSIKERVDTDLPVAVLLSGGVDSSLIMEIATRFHKNITAFILGKPGSSDYEAALKLCKENNYKYQIVYPNVNYEEKIEELIYSLEIYEAQVIRQSFALDILSKEVVRHGFRIALVGDGADEILAGYNEFSKLNNIYINKACKIITNDLHKSHNIRLDRMSMKHTLETRAPFLDHKVVDFSMNIDGKLKVKKENHHVVTKNILREVALDFLPDYIVWRYKVPFANGAGMDVGYNFKRQDGSLVKGILKKFITLNKLDKKVVKKYGFLTEEENIYFNLYKKFNFHKLNNNHERIVTKETLSDIDENSNKKLMVAEFGRMPLYFPMYLANKLSIYKKHGIEVEFMSSGNDNTTYSSLITGSAQIGIADPVFTYTKNFETQGKIMGSFINVVPLVAVTINPGIDIEDLKDFKGYSIGTYEEYSSTHTLVKELFPENKLVTAKPSDLNLLLKNREADIIIATVDYALDLKSKGARIIYNFENTFKNYLFTGINVANNLDKKYDKSVNSFLVSLKESINFIKKNKKESLQLFKGEFKGFNNHEDIFNNLIKIWDKKLINQEKKVMGALSIWKKSYYNLIKKNLPHIFENNSLENKILNILVHSKNSRDIPYREDKMLENIGCFVIKNKSIDVFGFWGAAGKSSIDKYDRSAIEKFNLINDQVKEIYPPGLNFIFILADHHARLNSYNKNYYEKYVKEVSCVFKKNNFKFIKLSSIWKKYSIDDKYLNKKIKELTDKDWKTIRFRSNLEKAAEAKGFYDYVKNAKRYYVSRIIEKSVLEKEYKGKIFHTYSEDIYQDIFPDLPTLYLWVDKKGNSFSPWFK